jgi:hypothetical protein
MKVLSRQVNILDINGGEIVWALPDDLTAGEALAVCRELAKRYPEAVIVASDEAQAHGAEVHRHPDDVAAIEKAAIYLDAIKWDYVESKAPTERDWNNYCKAWNLLLPRVGKDRAEELREQAGLPHGPLPFGCDGDADENGD